MKTFLFVFLLLISTFRLFSQSNWTWQYPYPQGNELNSVKFTDINTGYSVGMKGTILKTTNGGINWDLQISDVRFDLFNSYFLNSEKGFVIGDKGIVLSTANGGLNWELTVINSNIKFYSIDFTDSLTGWIIGFNDILQQSVLFKT